MLKGLLSKWILPVSYQIWLLVAGVFGVLVLAVKLLGKSLIKEKLKNESLESEVKRAERIQNVEINVDRESALKRLRGSGNVRDD